MSNILQESRIQSPLDPALRLMKREPHLRGIHNLQPNILWLLDATLLIAFALVVMTNASDLSFHLMTVLLAIGAFSWQLRGFLSRTTICMAGASAFLILCIALGRAEKDALIEIPLTAMILLPIIIISRRKAKVEEELASVARFPEENPNPILRVARDGKILYRNLAGAKLFQSLGGDHGNHVPDDWKPDITQTFQSNERKEIEYRIGARLFACLLVPVVSEGYINIYAGDVTERKHAEEELAEKHSLLRTLIDILPDPISAKDTAGQILIANAAQARLLGRTEPEDLLGKTYLDFFPREFALEYLADEQAIMQSGQPRINSAESSIDPDGNQKWISTTRVPFRDRAGRIVGLVSAGRDITEYKQVEAALRKSEESFQRIVNSIEDILYSVDGKTREFTYLSPAFQKLLGYTEEDIRRMGGRVAFLDQVIQEQVTIQSGATFEQLATKESTEAPISAGWWRCKGGSLVCLEDRSMPVYDCDRLIGTFGVLRDVTARKQAEKALAQERNMLRTLIDSLPDLIYVKDAESRFLVANTAQVQLLGGKTPEDLLGKSDLDFFPKEFAEKYLADEQVILRSGQPLLNYEEETIEPNGNRKWILTNKVPFRDSAGKVGGFVGAGRDITFQKQVEEDLAQERNMLRTLIDNLPDYVYIKDAESRIIVTNIANAHILRVETVEQTIGKTDYDFFPEQEAVQYRADEQALICSGQPLVNHEELSTDVAGNPRWTLTTKVPLRDNQGAVIGLVGIGRDITKRKQIEEELRQQRDFALQIMNTMGQGLVVTNADDRFEFVNPACAKTLGYSPEQLIGRAPEEIAFPEELSLLAQANARHSVGEASTYEIRLKRADGNAVHALITSVPRWRDRPGVAAIAVVTDLTERKQMEEALAQARDQAMTASRLKSEFLATMSHEIRTPMNSIIGMSEMLLGTPLNDQQREFAIIIDQSGNALLSLINDILDFSKIEAGKFALESIDFEVPTTIEGTAEILAVKAREKHLALMTYVSPEIPRWLRGDPGRLRQVLINLIGNAVKFTHAGEIVVRVELKDKSDTGVTVRFAVSDTGIGLSEEARQRLFQPFTQADGSTTRKYGGTGLGLAISKRLVEMMGGTIGVESEVGHGSTFWFTARFENASMVAPAKVDVRGLRALVVDDIKSHRTIVQNYLSSWGIHAQGAANGAEALQALRVANADEESYALAIIDLRMPEMDGLTLAREVKREPALASTRLILLTAFDEKGQGEEALQAGFSAYLTKPVKQSHLFDAITNVLNVSPPATPPEQSPKREAELPIPQMPPPTMSHKRILLAEDNLINQKVAMLQLGKLGFAAQTVTNGREALEAVVSGADAYLLVLMDCQMPEMDGFDAARAIRKAELTSGRHIPIIAMTANAMEGDRERCIAVGMDDYISKPVTLENLNKVLHLWLPKEKENA